MQLRIKFNCQGKPVDNSLHIIVVHYSVNEPIKYGRQMPSDYEIWRLAGQSICSRSTFAVRALPSSGHAILWYETSTNRSPQTRKSLLTDLHL